MSTLLCFVALCLFSILTGCGSYQTTYSWKPVLLLPGSGDSSADPQTSPQKGAAPSFGSCTYASQKMCIDYQSSQAAQNMKDSCSLSGKFSANERCSETGKVSGCRMTVQGTHYLITWAYDSQSKGLVESSCQSQASGRGGMTAVVLKP